MENKIWNYINEQFSKYIDLPVKEWFDEGELDSFNDSKRTKMIKKLESFKIELISAHASNNDLYNKATDDMNSIQDTIVGVIDGKEGNPALGSKEFILIATTKNVYIYTREDTMRGNVFGIFGVIGKAVKNSVTPFKKYVYSVNEFIDSAIIGNQYAGLMDDFVNWSYGGFFKKFKVFYIMRPMYRKLVDDLLKVQNGTYNSSERQQSSSSNDYIEELKQLKSLLDDKIISQEEFEKKKTEILNRN